MQVAKTQRNALWVEFSAERAALEGALAEKKKELLALQAAPGMPPPAAAAQPRAPLLQAIPPGFGGGLAAAEGPSGSPPHSWVAEYEHLQDEELARTMDLERELMALQRSLGGGASVGGGSIVGWGPDPSAPGPKVVPTPPSAAAYPARAFPRAAALADSAAAQVRPLGLPWESVSQLFNPVCFSCTVQAAAAQKAQSSLGLSRTLTVRASASPATGQSFYDEGPAAVRAVVAAVQVRDACCCLPAR